MSSLKRYVLGLIAALGLVIASTLVFATSSGADPSGSGGSSTSPGNPYTTSSSSGSSGSQTSGSSASGSSGASGSQTSGTNSNSGSSSETAPPGNCSTNNSGSSVGVNCSGFAGETSLCVGTSPGDNDLASGKSNADGNFSTSVPTSSLSNGETVYVGPCNGTAAESASVTIHLGGGSSGGGNLSNTGVAVVGIGALGLVLLVGGAMLLLAGRRRGGAHA